MPLLGQKQTQKNKQTWPLPRVQLLKVNIFVCRYHGMILMVPDCDNFSGPFVFSVFSKKKKAKQKHGPTVGAWSNSGRSEQLQTTSLKQTDF